MAHYQTICFSGPALSIFSHTSKAMIYVNIYFISVSITSETVCIFVNVVM